MSIIEPDDRVRAVSLGIDGDEAALGIVRAKCVTWRRTVVVIVETSCGLMASGNSVVTAGGDPLITRGFARARAIRHLRRAMAERGEAANGNQRTKEAAE